MKNVLLTLAVVALFAAPAMAADGNLSHDMLSKMGLSGIQVMSDTQGNAVRGLGFSVAFGASYAKVNHDAASVNGYLAVDKAGRHGGSLAGGANLSFAGEISVGGGDLVRSQNENHNGGLHANVVFAGGGSIAFTK